MDNITSTDFGKNLVATPQCIAAHYGATGLRHGYMALATTSDWSA